MASNVSPRKKFAPIIAWIKNDLGLENENIVFRFGRVAGAKGWHRAVTAPDGTIIQHRIEVGTGQGVHDMSAINTLAHELRHAYQMKVGWLRYDTRTYEAVWKGRRFAWYGKRLPWEDRPWEKDSINYQYVAGTICAQYGWNFQYIDLRPGDTKDGVAMVSANEEDDCPW